MGGFPAYIVDPQAKEDQLNGILPALVNGRQEIVDRLLLKVVQLAQVVGCQIVKISYIVHQVLGDQLLDDLWAKASNVHGLPGGEVGNPFFNLGRAGRVNARKATSLSR